MVRPITFRPGSNQEAIKVRRYEPDEAARVIEQAEVWQERFRQERGDTFFHLGDEFYLMTGRDVPESEHYAGFPQVEDGIGITRFFLDEMEAYLRRARPGVLRGTAGTIATATLIAPTMAKAIERFNTHTGAELRVRAITNEFLGPEINVSGLLSGQDIVAQLKDEPAHGAVFLTRKMVSDRTATLIDDMSIADVATGLGRRVQPADKMAEVAAVLRRQRPALQVA